MSTQRKLKVGLVGVMQLCFTGDKQAQLDKGITGLKELSEKLNFDFFYYPELLVTAGDAQKARKALETEKIDFLLVQGTSFAAGDLIPVLAKTDVYLGLWAVPEPNTSGYLALNSFCLVNMYASIISNYLKEYSIKYKWFYGNYEDELFIERFKVTIKALTVIKKMKNARVALIGGIAHGFNDLYFDERLAEKRLGVEIQRNYEFSEIRQRVLSYKAEDLADTLKIVSFGYKSINDKVKSKIESNARLYKAYSDFAKEYNYEALAISCWPKMQGELDMMVCSTIGKLNQNGIPAACEGDLPGAVSMLLLKYITDDVSMLMDLVAFDEKDESVQMWHCGPAAECFANENGVCLDLWYESDSKEIVRRSAVHDMVFKSQKVTAMRLTGEWDRMFLMDGKCLDTPKDSYFGSRGWIGDLRLNRNSIKARDLINTILVQGFQHHYAIIPGDVTEVLMEIAAWLDLKPVEAVEYRNYLQNKTE